MTREQVLIRKGKGARIEHWILIVYRSGGEAELAEEPGREDNSKEWEIKVEKR